MPCRQGGPAQTAALCNSGREGAALCAVETPSDGATSEEGGAGEMGTFSQDAQKGPVLVVRER